MNKKINRLFGFILIFSVFGCLITSSDLQAQTGSTRIEIKDRNGKSILSYKGSYALVVWAADYKYWSKLNNVEIESQRIVDVLERRGFQVTIVKNPTSNNLENSIEKFIDNYGYDFDNRLVFFFTGHGYTRKTQTTTKGYFVPVDAPDPITREGEKDFSRSALSMQKVMAWAREIESKHAMFIFDSCFSGSLFKVKSNSNINSGYIQYATTKPVRQFLTAGDADQEVPAQSIFVPLLIRGLDGEADFNNDGYVTGSELGVFLRQSLPNYTNQFPQYGTIRDVFLDQGDLVFRSLIETPPKNYTPLPIVPPERKSPPSKERDISSHIATLSNYTIGLYPIPTNKAKQKAQRVKSSLETAGFKGIIKIYDKSSDFFERVVPPDSNEIRYYSGLETQQAESLKAILDEFYPELNIVPRGISTPTPNFISIFLDNS